MTDRELMQQALDLLDDINQCSLPPTGIPLPAEIDHVMEALRARLANEFNPDWDAMAVMVEEQQRMAKRIEELEARLAQPEQEPVAQVHVAEDYYPHVIWAEGINAACFDQEYLYITPPQREWQTLTDDEIRIAWGPYFSRGVDVARVIEAMLKRKNT